jgi:hypothetical protein
MVRNAMRIILLVVLKLNDENVNRLLTDVPFATLFANLACFLRDQVTELELAHNPECTLPEPFPLTGKVRVDKLDKKQPVQGKTGHMMATI